MAPRPSDWTPFASLLRALGLLLCGCVRLGSQELGWVLTADDGRRFTVFRQLVVQASSKRRRPAGAVVVARFRLSRWAARWNRWFSWLPILFFIGLPGFRSKRWMEAGETGECCGYYEWATEEDAARYTRSFAARFMAARALPGTASCRWYPAAAAPPPPQPE
jgi:hypothetical protein